MLGSVSASTQDKAINTPLKSRISSRTRVLMTRRREMVENGHHKQRIEYAEICKNITKKSREDKRKYNHKRNDNGFKETEESQKNADARARQVDHTPR